MNVTSPSLLIVDQYGLTADNSSARSVLLHYVILRYQGTNPQTRSRLGVEIFSHT
jgi:hypothetical protein